MKHLLIAIICTLYCTSLVSQFEDECSRVLQYASRDIQDNYSKANTAKYIYDNYCEGNSLKSGTNIGVEAEDLMSSVGLSFGNSKESVSQICKTYVSDYKATVEKKSHSNIVVRESIEAWLDCKTLSKAGIKVRPLVQPTQFSVDIARIQDDVTISGINYDESKCECEAFLIEEGSLFTSDEMKRSKVGANTVHKINSGDIWSIQCRRLPKLIDSGEIYEEIDFSVSTSKGTFQMSLPRNIKPNYNWVSDVTITLEELKTRNEELAKELEHKYSKVNGRFKQILFKKACISRESDCNGSKWKALKPPSGWVDTGITDINTYSGGPCGQGTLCKIWMKIGG